MIQRVAKRVIINRGRDKSLRHHHPWIFSGAIQKVEGTVVPGETVQVVDSDGNIIGYGAYSPQSQIAVRMWSFEPGEEIGPEFFRGRIQQAYQRRQQLIPLLHTDAIRLINAESDGLPGLIVDRYGDFLVCQFLSAGAEFWRAELITILQELFPAASLYERSDVEIRAKEGLPLRKGLLSGVEPPEVIEIYEHQCRFLVDIRNGHKTGFYLDQRDNRQQLAAFAAGREVLNCFSYTGGFTVPALLAGARQVTNVESSAAALELLERNVALNGCDRQRIENQEADVFHKLRHYRDAGRSFDLIILDPPKFAESKSQLASASRGYKDINLLAFKLLRPGGILFTFSCSGQMVPELFQKIVADAALDAGRSAQIIGRLSQAPDHAVEVQFPEGGYLKGLICLVD